MESEKRVKNSPLKPTLTAIVTAGSMVSAASTILTFVFFPREYRYLLPWMLLGIAILTAVIAFIKIERAYESREAYLRSEITRLSKRPYDDALRLKVEQAMKSLSERNIEIMRVVLNFGPISAHNAATQMGSSSVDNMRGELNALCGSHFIELKNHNGDWKYEIIPQFIKPIQDFLYPNS